MGASQTPPPRATVLGGQTGAITIHTISGFQIQNGLYTVMLPRTKPSSRDSRKWAKQRLPSLGCLETAGAGGPASACAASRVPARRLPGILEASCQRQMFSKVKLNKVTMTQAVWKTKATYTENSPLTSLLH